MTVAIPSIGREFGVGTSELTKILLAYVLVAAVTLIPFGRLADVYGRKRLFVLGAMILVVSSFFLLLSFSLSMLVALRALQGMGAAMVLGTAVALLTSVYPSNGDEHGRERIVVRTRRDLRPIVGRRLELFRRLAEHLSR